VGVSGTRKVDVVSAGCSRAWVVLECKAVVVLIRTRIVVTVVNKVVSFSTTIVFSTIEVPVPAQNRDLDFDIVDTEGLRVKIVSPPDIVRMSRARRGFSKARLLYITYESTNTI
jgi:hypothetical protein